AVTVSSRTRLGGAEMNSLVNLIRGSNVGVDLIAGFRYLNLKENLALDNTTVDTISNTITQLHDRFDTGNQFYGGQIGTRLTWAQNSWSVALTGKVALGDTQQVVNINGYATQTGPTALVQGTFPGGFFTQPSNIGRRYGSQFGVVPEVEVKLAYQF